MSIIASRCFRAAALVAVAALGAPAAADTIHFEAFLDGLQEVPPVATPATGLATITVDTGTLMATFHMEFSGLIGTQTAAHVHGPAAPGVNAGVLFPVPNGSPSDTMFLLTMTQYTNLQNGLLYVNVHTNFRPGGEIRGQFHKVPAPSGAALLGLAGLAALRRRR